MMGTSGSQEGNKLETSSENVDLNNSMEDSAATVLEDETSLIEDHTGQIFVEGNRNSKSKRIWDKSDYCFYCKLRVRTTSLGQHSITKHADEEKVKEIVNAPKNSKLRRMKLQLMRNAGNFLHNMASLRMGGSVIPVSRPSRTIDITNYLSFYAACDSCLGFYPRYVIQKHRCPALNNRSASCTKLPALAIGNTKKVISFLKRLKYDDIGKIMVNDETIMNFIRDEINSKSQKQFRVISSQSRNVARFLKELRTRSSTEEHLSYFMTPNHFDFLHQTIIEMFRYDSSALNMPTMENPSGLRCLIQVLTKINGLLRVQYLCELNYTRADEQKALKEMEAKLSRMRTNATKSMKCSVSGIPKDLPSQEDQKTFNVFLKEKLRDALNVKDIDLRRISELVIGRLLYFNKRRSSEVPRLTKAHWELKAKWKEDAMDARLSESEKEIVSQMEITYVLGKGNEYVPIIFPDDCVKAVNFLLSNQNITADDYIFQNKRGGPLRGCDVIRKLAHEKGLRNMGTTKFRKSAATKLQSKDYAGPEYEALCQHLGHTMNVHQRWYRMRDSTIALAKVGQMLIANEEE